MERERGLTATELTIATAIVVLGAAVAGANASSRRIEANETTAVAALEAIHAAQERFKAARYVDVDGDGVGEYGLMREMTGRYPRRTLANGSATNGTFPDPVLSDSFSDVPFDHAPRFPSGVVARSGYRFRIVLPTHDGTGVVEVGSGALAMSLDADVAETAWCCYAWPEKYDDSGHRTFFVNQTGTLVATDGQIRYREYGPAEAATAGAAFQYGGRRTSITGQVAINTTGSDGNFWRLVSPRPRAQTTRARASLFDRPSVEGGPRGSVTIAAHKRPAGSEETLTLRGRRLLPNHQYELVLEDVYRSPESRASFGTIRTDAHGRVFFRFDSRESRFPPGVTSLLDYVPGWVELSYDDRYTPVGGKIRALVTRADSEARESRIGANEAAAIGALREIAAAQSEFRARKAADINGDGDGEYGLLRELMCEEPVRTLANGMGTGAFLRPQLLSPGFGRTTQFGGVMRAGYRFRMVLPGYAGVGVIEIGEGALATAIDSQLAATTWACYAWPVRRGETGLRTFFINQSGQVIASDTANYSGEFAIAAANCGAALAPGETLTSILGDLAIGAVGRDGNLWRAVPSRADERVVETHGTIMMSSYSSGPSATFSIESRQLRDATEESITIEAVDLWRSALWPIVLKNAAGDVSADFGLVTSDANGRVRFVFDSRLQKLPDGVESIAAFLGGTIELSNGPYIAPYVATIPETPTLTGPRVADSSITWRAKTDLAVTPLRTMARGSLEVAVTNAPEGSHQTVTVAVVTNDVAADRVDVVAIQGGVDYPLGSVDLHGLRGAGKSVVYAADGGAIPGGGVAALSGTRIEVRDPTGAVLLTGTFPSVE